MDIHSHAAKKKKSRLILVQGKERKEKVLSFNAKQREITSGPIMVDPSRVVVEKNKLNDLFAVESGGKTNGPGSFPSSLPAGSFTRMVGIRNEGS